MCSFLIRSALPQYLLLYPQSSDVKDVGYVIVRLSRCREPYPVTDNVVEL